MASSPLELYDKAYRFHYVENRIPAAVDLYKRLIKEFPDANECGYAVIQLQKIKAQNVAASFSDDADDTSGKKSNPLLFFCLFLSIGSLIFSAFLYTSFSKELTIRKKNLALAMNALGKIGRNEYKEALILLDELKQADPEAIAPYELSADIYRKQQHYDKAKNEYLTFFKNNPDIQPSISESIYMSLDKQPEKKVTAAPKPAIGTRRAQPPPKKTPPKTRKKVVRKKRRIKKTPPPPPDPASTKKKGIYLVDPDSVSYF